MERIRDDLAGERFEILAIHVGPSLDSAKRAATELGVTFPVGGLPDVPGDVRILSFNGSEAQLTWSDPDDREEEFVIEQSSDGANWNPAAIVPADTTAATNGAVPFREDHSAGISRHPSAKRRQ